MENNNSSNIPYQYMYTIINPEALEAGHWEHVQDEVDAFYEAQLPDMDADDSSDFSPLGDLEWNDFQWESDIEEDPVSLRQWAPGFVASLERVSTSSIPADNMMCPICWVDFGETNEFHELYEPPELPSDFEEAVNMLAFRGLPFDLSRPNNDAVRLPCGHLFGLDCIAENLTTSSLCPMCRAELRR